MPDPLSQRLFAFYYPRLVALAENAGQRETRRDLIAEARGRWHAATEHVRQRVLIGDGELRRRHPGIELPPLHPDAEEAADVVAPGTASIELERESLADWGGTLHHDIEAALEVARRAQQILAERREQSDREVALASDDVMRRRAADALRESEARASAVRQEPAPSRRAASIERDEAELEAGQ